MVVEAHGWTVCAELLAGSELKAARNKLNQTLALRMRAVGVAPQVRGQRLQTDHTCNHWTTVRGLAAAMEITTLQRWKKNISEVYRKMVIWLGKTLAYRTKQLLNDIACRNKNKLGLPRGIVYYPVPDCRYALHRHMGCAAAVTAANFSQFKHWAVSVGSCSSICSMHLCKVPVTATESLVLPTKDLVPNAIETPNYLKDRPIARVSKAVCCTLTAVKLSFTDLDVICIPVVVWLPVRAPYQRHCLLRSMVKLQQVEDSWPVVVVDMPAVLNA